MTSEEYFFRAFFKCDPLNPLLSEKLDVWGRGVGYLQAYHKSSHNDVLYRVPSEYVSGKIGEFIGLPVPPFGISRHADGRQLFSSLDFNFKRATLPRIHPDIFVEKLPSLATGILIFDIFIGNEDRHDENLLVDRVAAPTMAHVFDHDQALLSGSQLTGTAKLAALTTTSGITGAAPIGGRKHMFLELLDTSRHFDYWIRRVMSIPDFFLEDICRFASLALQLPEADSQCLIDHLMQRRNYFAQLVANCRDDFAAIHDWNPVGLFS